MLGSVGDACVCAGEREGGEGVRLGAALPAYASHVQGNYNLGHSLMAVCSMRSACAHRLGA